MQRGDQALSFQQTNRVGRAHFEDLSGCGNHKGPAEGCKRAVGWARIRVASTGAGSTLKRRPAPHVAGQLHARLARLPSTSPVLPTSLMHWSALSLLSIPSSAHAGRLQAAVGDHQGRREVGHLEQRQAVVFVIHGSIRHTLMSTSGEPSASCAARNARSLRASRRQCRSAGCRVACIAPTLMRSTPVAAGDRRDCFKGECRRRLPTAPSGAIRSRKWATHCRSVSGSILSNRTICGWPESASASCSSVSTSTSTGTEGGRPILGRLRPPP